VSNPETGSGTAIRSAAAVTEIRTEAVVADKPEKASAPAGDPTGGMGGMDFQVLRIRRIA
jgi:chaperonin GroEL